MYFDHTEESYQAQLDTKTAITKNQFKAYGVASLEVFPSVITGFRMRAEFKIWHLNGKIHYAMHQPGSKKDIIIIDKFPIAAPSIQILMPELLAYVQNSEILKHKLFQIEFLATTTGELLVTLIYHKKLDETWVNNAKNLSLKFRIQIIGRSKGQKLVLDKDFVNEALTVNDVIFHYQQREGSFTQPNADICEKMLNWAFDICKHANGDLLELYCGNGNFTLPLSKAFHKILATEISKTSIQSAKVNCENNRVHNIEFVRMASEEIAEALNGGREFRRLKDIDLRDYNFSTVFVDPPRAGLDGATLSIVKNFNRILYISCNPDSLARDLDTITKTHKIARVALFDQFPYTEHRECGMELIKVK